jgi:hypothetical protein
MAILVVLLSIGCAALLFFVLARYAKNPTWVAETDRATASKQHLPPGRLLDLVRELLPRMGLYVTDSEPLAREGTTRLAALGKGALRDSRHVIYVLPRPESAIVGPEILRELAEDVDKTHSAMGVLIAPCIIDSGALGGFDVELELIDGLALASLVRQHLPHRAVEIDAYQLTGTVTQPPSFDGMAPPAPAAT